MTAWIVLIAIAAMSCLAAWLEGWWHQRVLRRIPIRIHVNGTRGKSSVTRLIAAGLRAGGIRTCAKTTGTLPRMILCDGSEVPIYRPGRTNIIEQKRVIRTAVDHAAEALVVECMALQPLLQSVCELKLIQSTHGVITNARADHLDVMGPTRGDVARALAGSVSVNGDIFTAEHREESLAILAAAARDRRSRLHAVDPDEIADVTQAEMSGFSYLEHADNVALALRVCQTLGVDRADAIEGMCSAEPDSGAMKVYRTQCDNSIHYFVNAFAANDPESSEQIWHSTFDRFPECTAHVLVMNCRDDRIDRSITMADAAINWARPSGFVVIGTGTEAFVRRLLSRGVSPDQLLCLGEASADAILAAIARFVPSSAVIVGIGNVAGRGMELAAAYSCRQANAARHTPPVVEAERQRVVKAAPLAVAGPLQAEVLEVV